jgi:hypothetical protein
VVLNNLPLKYYQDVLVFLLVFSYAHLSMIIIIGHNVVNFQKFGKS